MSRLSSSLLLLTYSTKVSKFHTIHGQVDCLCLPCFYSGQNLSGLNHGGISVSFVSRETRSGEELVEGCDFVVVVDDTVSSRPDNEGRQDTVGRQGDVYAVPRPSVLGTIEQTESEQVVGTPGKDTKTKEL